MVMLSWSWPHVLRHRCFSAGPEQTSGSGAAVQSGRVREAGGWRLQAAGTAAWVLRHGRIPGHLHPETGNHRPHRSEDPQRAVRYQKDGGDWPSVVDDSSTLFFIRIWLWDASAFYWKIVAIETKKGQGEIDDMQQKPHWEKLTAKSVTNCNSISAVFTLAFH